MPQVSERLGFEDYAFGKDGLTVTRRQFGTRQEGWGVRPYGSNPAMRPVGAMRA
jgi:hypothetical protein